MRAPSQTRARHSAAVQTKRSPLQRGEQPIGEYKTQMTENAGAIRGARHRSEDMRIARELGLDWRTM